MTLADFGYPGFLVFKEFELFGFKYFGFERT
jgi:hypothetical protein